jgi:hypothetical protein
LSNIPEVHPKPPPAVLFRFRRFPSLAGLTGERFQSANSEREHLYDLVCNGHVRFALPTTFVDHFDCRAYPIEAFDDPEQQREAVLTGLQEFVRTTNPHGGDRFLNDPKMVEHFRKRFLSFAEQAFMQMRAEIGIYCMCAVADRPAMWALYADAGRGVCIQLDARRPPFDLSEQVVYQEDVACYPMPIQTENSLHRNFVMQQMFFVKNTDWQHEREYRFVSAYAEGQEKVLAEHGVRVQGMDLYFPPARVLAICVGPAMERQTILELKEGLAQRMCNVPIFRAEMSTRKHEVLFRERV